MKSELSTQAIQDKEAYRWMSQSCPICAIPPNRFLGRRGGASHRQGLGVQCEVWRCGRCGLIFPNPMPVPANGLEQHYGTVPDDYFRNHDIDAKGLGALRLLRRAEALIGGKGALLDIGAGRGELLRAASQEGWHVVGIEPSTPFAEYARRYSGAEIYRDPVECCGFSPESFDVVVMSAVLEHLYNPDETVREVSRILRPGGVLFVDVPNEQGLYFRIGNLYQKLRLRNWVVNLAPTFEPFHTFGFSPRSLKALLSKHGFEPADWLVYGGRSFLPSLDRAGGALERLGAKLVTAASRYGELGTYIETWARKLA